MLLLLLLFFVSPYGCSLWTFVMFSPVLLLYLVEPVGHCDQLIGEEEAGVLFSLHYENTPTQIYRKFHLQKPKYFKIKNSDIFSYSCSKHRLWVPVRTTSARRF